MTMPAVVAGSCIAVEEAVLPLLVEGGVCGNSASDLGEECDDGNTTAGDGCSANCQLEFCGNGILNSGEECDDDNASSGDGCSETCRFEVQ